MKRFFSILMVLALVLVMMPAGAYADSPVIDSVGVSPSSPDVAKDSSKQFTAVVSGENGFDTTVSWSISGNHSSSTVISADGLLTIASDETAAVITVTATANGDNTKYGTAEVTVTASAAERLAAAEQAYLNLKAALEAVPKDYTALKTAYDVYVNCEVEYDELSSLPSDYSSVGMDASAVITFAEARAAFSADENSATAANLLNKADAVESSSRKGIVEAFFSDYDTIKARAQSVLPTYYINLDLSGYGDTDVSGAGYSWDAASKTLTLQGINVEKLYLPDLHTDDVQITVNSPEGIRNTVGELNICNTDSGGYALKTTVNFGGKGVLDAASLSGNGTICTVVISSDSVLNISDSMYFGMGGPSGGHLVVNGKFDYNGYDTLMLGSLNLGSSASCRIVSSSNVGLSIGKPDGAYDNSIVMAEEADLYISGPAGGISLRTSNQYTDEALKSVFRVPENYLPEGYAWSGKEIISGVYGYSLVQKTDSSKSFYVENLSGGYTDYVEGGLTPVDLKKSAGTTPNPNPNPNPNPPADTYVPIVNVYKITVEQTEGGHVSQSRFFVAEGADVDFTVTPDEGMEIADLLMNDVSVGPQAAYTYENVKSDLTVKAVFTEAAPPVEEVPAEPVEPEAPAEDPADGELTDEPAEEEPASGVPKTGDRGMLPYFAGLLAAAGGLMLLKRRAAN